MINWWAGGVINQGILGSEETFIRNPQTKFKYNNTKDASCKY